MFPTYLFPILICFQTLLFSNIFYAHLYFLNLFSKMHFNYYSKHNRFGKDNSGIPKCRRMIFHSKTVSYLTGNKLRTIIHDWDDFFKFFNYRNLHKL